MLGKTTRAKKVKGGKIIIVEIHKTYDKETQNLLQIEQRMPSNKLPNATLFFLAVNPRTARYSVTCTDIPAQCQFKTRDYAHDLL